MNTLRRMLGTGSLVLFAVFALAAIAGLLWPCESALTVDIGRKLAGPSFAHVLGTDWLGRDLLGRTVCGTRGFFAPGFAAVLVAGVLGVGLGALAGYEPTMRRRGPRAAAARALRTTVTLGLAIPGTLPRFVSIVFSNASR